MQIKPLKLWRWWCASATQTLRQCRPAGIAAIAIVLYLIPCCSFTKKSLDPNLSCLFSDNMVLQRNQPIKIWGTGPAFEEIQVSLGGTTRWAWVRNDSSWLVEFPPLSAGGPYCLTITTAGRCKKSINNILIGDVFFCSGQSNMSCPLSKLAQTKQDIQDSADSQLRFLAVNCGGWHESSPSTVKECSALAFFFGKYLRGKLKVPTGLIVTAYPGTSIRSWLRSGLSERFTECKRHNTVLPDGYLDQNLIAPFCTIGLTAFVWYQGEADLPASQHYCENFDKLISDWRIRWKRGNIPVLFVQLPNMGHRFAHSIDSYWAQFREIQAACRSIPNCFMVVTCDTAPEIVPPLHSTGKKEVARRLALLVLKNIYHIPETCNFPEPLAFKFDRSVVKIKYGKTGGPITLKPCCPSGFEISGESGVFRAAEANLENNVISLQAPGVVSPKFIRYAWADNPVCSVYSADGFPAAPFRTDHFQPRAQFVKDQDYLR